MRLCLISSEHNPCGGLGGSVQRLARLLACEHEVTVVHAYETAVPDVRPGDPSRLRHVIVDPSRLPPIAFSCDDHARSAAVMLAIEETFGDRPPDYLEAPDYRGHGLVPLQARNAGHRSMRGCAVGVRLRGMAEMICLHDGAWSRPEHRIVFDVEREALRLADFVVWPGGDVLAVYRRLLGDSALPVAERVRLPVDHPGETPHPAARPAAKPLKILYAGRLQRVKGVLPLVEACMRLEAGAWRLAMVGGDTDTAPLGQSMRDTIETMCAGDPRVTLHAQVSQGDLQQILPLHDLMVVPSKFEVWSNVALEAMRAGLPLLVTPVGGLTEVVEHGVTGWHATGSDQSAIGESLAGLLSNRDELERVRCSGEIFRRFEQLTGEDQVLNGYRDLLRRRCGSTLGVSSRRPAQPLVTAIVTYCGEHGQVGEAVSSLLSQSYRKLEAVIVNDGSFEPEDRVLAELAEDPRVRVLTQRNEGAQSARNLGVADADGDYVAMLDADYRCEPDFVERAVEMLDADPALAYVTCWLRLADDEAALETVGWLHGYPPLGNGVRSDDAIDSGGEVIAVLPRRLFSRLGYRYEEMALQAAEGELFRTLRDDGRLGAVIPELLARSDSFSHTFAKEISGRCRDESLSRRRARSLRWTTT